MKSKTLEKSTNNNVTSKILRIRRIVKICNVVESFQADKGKKKYIAQTITDVDYADDIGLMANTPAQAKILLYSLERASAGRGLHVNAHKTEYMFINQNCDISILNSSSLKLVDKFTFFF